MIERYIYSDVRKEHPITNLRINDVIDECDIMSLVDDDMCLDKRAILNYNPNLVESILIACKTRNGFRKTNMTQYPNLLNYMSIFGVYEIERRFNNTMKLLKLKVSFINNELHMDIIKLTA